MDSTAVSPPAPSLTRFDRLVLGVAVAILALIALILWRGDRVGLAAPQVIPADGSSGVSTRATLRFTFNQPMQALDVVPTFDPPITGTGSWNGRLFTFTPDEPLQPDTTYTVTLPAGLASQQGRSLLQPVTTTFSTGHTRIVYIGWDEARTGNQLYLVDPLTDAVTQLTNEPTDVIDFAISPDGQTIAYAIRNASGGSDLAAIDGSGQNRRLLLACPDAACSQPSWTENGRRLVYERRFILQPGSPPGSPRLYWLDIATGETVSVFDDNQWLGLGPRVAPGGGWISYVSLLTQEVHAYNFNNGEVVTILSRTGEPGAWSPDGRFLLATVVLVNDDQFAVHIWRNDVQNFEQINLSGENADVNDGLPDWSPTNEWIAFSRKVPREAMGKQVWLMRPDGSEQHAITDNPDIHFGRPVWSPDGRFLTFQGYALSAPGADPGIYLYDTSTNALTRLTTTGIQPAWLP